MPVVCFGSPKGGVGKTTLTATVGVALHRLGWRVLAIDFDRQNALRLHFELADDEVRGIADDIDAGRDWSDLVVETASGVFLIPFGMASVADSLRVQARATQNPAWIRDQLAPFFEYRDLVVVADMPPGPSAYHSAIEDAADLNIAVLLADAMSLALLPRLHEGTGGEPAAVKSWGRTAGDRRNAFLLNQIDGRRQLGRDVLALSQDVLGDDLYGAVHRDEAVAEAVACQLTVLDYAPESVASQDIAAVAQRVDRRLRA